MAENKGFSKNVDRIAFHDLDGKPGFQMAMQSVQGKYYLYLAHFRHAGWTILDVTDPSNPRPLRFVKGPEARFQSTLKIQVADGFMITSMSGGVEGIYIWDVKEDPENPKFLSHWSTGEPTGMTHRFFYSGGRYIHLSSTLKGFAGMIYRIVDIVDPLNPVEVGRWWLPEQWLPGLKPAEREAVLHRPDAQNIVVWAGLHGPPLRIIGLIAVGAPPA